MKPLLAAVVMMAGCATVPPEEPETVPEAGASGGECRAEAAQHLVGRPSSRETGEEAVRLSGAGAMRWIPEGGMVTMDYRRDRLNIHLDAQNRIARIACG